MAVSQVFKPYTSDIESKTNDIVKKRWVDLFSFMLFSFLETDDKMSALDKSSRDGSGMSEALLNALRMALTIQMSKSTNPYIYHVRVRVSARQLRDKIVNKIRGHGHRLEFVDEMMNLKLGCVKRLVERALWGSPLFSCEHGVLSM